MLRVLISSSTFPLAPDDGSPRFVLDLAQELTRHCQVLVLAPGSPGAPNREVWGDLEIRRFDYLLRRSWQRLAYGHGMRQNLRSWSARLQVLPYVIAAARATRALVNSWRPDVVNSHWLIPHGLATALALRRSAACPHVVSVHAGDVYFLARAPAGAAIARWVVVRTDALLADGSHVRDALDNLLGRPSGAVVEPMGVDLARFGAAAEPPSGRARAAASLVFVGRLVEKKGLLFLLRALPLVLARRPQLELVVVGDGPLEESLRAEASRLGIESSVSFAGRQGHDAVARHLRASTVAVVPSVVDRNGETDGMPTVVVEAMAAGARVVGTAVDGIPDLLRNRQNGWLCAPADAAALASAILEALEDDDVEAILREARATAARHSWSDVASRYAATFSRVSGRVPSSELRAEARSSHP
jgi:glycosyltransferase involved in cell wall biosynthesis